MKCSYCMHLFCVKNSCFPQWLGKVNIGKQLHSRCGEEFFERVRRGCRSTLQSLLCPICGSDVSSESHLVFCAINRDAIVELRFHSLQTPSMQTQLSSVIYENPLSDIPIAFLQYSFIIPLVQVKNAICFLYVQMIERSNNKIQLQFEAATDVINNNDNTKQNEQKKRLGEDYMRKEQQMRSKVELK